MSKAIEALRTAVEAKMVDDFETGTVIRWVASGIYNYAAIKVSDGRWFTTAGSYNSFVEKVYDFQGLVDLLARVEVSEIGVATGDSWVSL